MFSNLLQNSHESWRNYFGESLALDGTISAATGLFGSLATTGVIGGTSLDITTSGGKTLKLNDTTGLTSSQIPKLQSGNYQMNVLGVNCTTGGSYNPGAPHTMYTQPTKMIAGIVISSLGNSYTIPGVATITKPSTGKYTITPFPVTSGGTVHCCFPVASLAVGFLSQGFVVVQSQPTITNGFFDVYTYDVTWTLVDTITFNFQCIVV